MAPAESESHGDARLVIVSNRLPVVLEQDGDGHWSARPGSGGLVTALAPVLKDRGGLWIGWTGATDVEPEELSGALAEATEESGFELKAVPVSREEQEKYYRGFANEIVWPLFHDLLPRCNFMPSYWRAYRRVNRRFAQVVLEAVQEGDYVWVHDYHLMNVAQQMRRLGASQKIGFFLHTPFPPLDMFLRLPWRTEVLGALLQYDLLGFQTMRDLRNFLQCAEALGAGCRVEGEGNPVRLATEDREIRVGAFPISIDYQEFANLAVRPEVEQLIKSLMGYLPVQQETMLGIDRLDYTKGIPERLRGFRNALERYPELRGRLVLVQVVVPSRGIIPEYQELRNEIERLVSEINGQFTHVGWVPVQYIHRSLPRGALSAYYRLATYALVTPLKDGMNLIAKEYCASSLAEDSVLILSEFAGAAGQLQNDALMVNPHDIEGMADAIYAGFKMSAAERQRRMQNLRRSIQEEDIFWWVNGFLKAAFAQDLERFPRLVVRDYMPRIDVDLV
jgi:trehalose 6-phosphate synthase